MKRAKKIRNASAVKAACAALFMTAVLLGSSPANGHDGHDDASGVAASSHETVGIASDTCAGGAAACGQNSGLVPFHKDAIHAGLIWNGESECPKMLILMRPSEATPNQYLDPTVNGMFSGFNMTYQELMQGDFNLGSLDRSGWSRYAPDLERENAQLIDVCGLQALVDNGAFTKTAIADLTDADMALTDPFFSDAGYSRGMNYNLFCAGVVAGTDSRTYVFGIHDKGGNNGGRKVNIFKPENEKWADRPLPCVKEQFEDDPLGTYEHCDPLDENNTDPYDASDMKYQRWYPTAVTLPDGKILILSGSDQDTSVGSEMADMTKVRQSVPEVYDPETDTTIALENARKLMPMYPRAFVVQTGPEEDDWKVCATGEVAFMPANMEPYDPFTYNGKTSCLDVQAALADPNRDTPGENHWELIDTAASAHDSGAAVMLTTINADGSWQQEVVLFGGTSGRGTGRVAIVEKIDYSDPDPRWERQADLATTTTQNNAVALPDGKVLIVGGRNSFHYQMYDPANGSVTKLIESPIPRHDHSTALLMPDGNVWIMGGNRVDLLPSAQENLAVPVMESYRPPYFFRGARPELSGVPARLRYGEKFQLKATGNIASVALLRTGPITHNWAWGNTYVKLPFTAVKKTGQLTVTAPPLPGLAVAGDYLLFVVDGNGVPSAGLHVHLGKGN